ncbi:MAG TPA: FlgD immunoglobulin-like domain containing protein [Chloroflexia bacterium]|nr:FlgD immunoglobulin-like domain containing protein [Chloroflexia bacterium]
MRNQADQNTRTGNVGHRSTPRGRTRGWGLRLFGQRTPDGMPSPAPGPLGHFSETWISRLLIGGALLLLAIVFPLQWLRTPTLVVRANVGTFAPHPGVAAPEAPGASTGAVTASYDLSEDADISAWVYDAAGAVVKTLLTEKHESAGPHFILWDGTTDNGTIAPDAAYRIAVTAKGPARSTSGNVTVTVDTTPPAVKLVNLADGEKLKTADLVVQGLTEPGATVQFADGGALITADGGGAFTLHRPLVHGTNTFTVLVRDASGNETTVARTVELLDRPPAIKIDTPVDGAWTNQKLVTVSGQVDPGSTVSVNNQETAAGPDGRFHVDVVLDEGANNLAVEATDPVGNKARVEERVNLDTRPPAIQIDSLADDATVHTAQVHLYGLTDPGVKLSVQGRLVVVDQQGHFDTPVDLIVGANTIHLEAQDQAGNVTALDRKVRYDLSTSSFPDLPITGAATALAIIVLAWVLFGGWFSSVSLKLATDRPAFAPGRYGVGQTERMLITYSLSKRARTTLQVVDGSGALVTTLLRTAPRSAGDHQLLWDGATAQGTFAPPGKYVIQAQARTLTSAVSTSAPLTVVGGAAAGSVSVGGYGGYPPPAPGGAAPPARYTYGYGERGTTTGETTTPPERNILRGDRG